MPGISNKLKVLGQNIRNPAWLCFVWFGMTAGISLLAAPIRFTASTITRPIALDVGEVVFQALNKAELVALILLLVLVRVSGRARELWAYVATIALIVLAQSIWLLPTLANRTEIIVAGGEPAPSMAHAGYAATEICKLVLLLILGFRSMIACQYQANQE